ncbi:hypothetical protein LTR10_003806 [Elasticomyces elasticus]|nr:hypothetical protein LTR10_003806 [Elasticomyces elasticus]KAK4978006.1 hypothetical protein LTR42_002381 [Elasticomyces elasticus]
MLYAKHLLHARHAASLYQGTPLEESLTKLARYVAGIRDNTRVLFVYTEALTEGRDGQVTLDLRPLGTYPFLDFEGAESVFIPGKPLTGLAFQTGLAWAVGDAAAKVFPAKFPAQFSAGNVNWSTLEKVIPRAVPTFESVNNVPLEFIFIPLMLKNRWTVQARIRRGPVEDS